ncbi:MAG: hypothetical protein ACREJ0_08825, partial [Geminicoccaceae bacterium]
MAQSLSSLLDRCRIQAFGEHPDRFGERPQLSVAERLLRGESVDRARYLLCRGIGHRRIEPWLQRGQGPGIGDQLEFLGILRVEAVARDVADALLADLLSFVRPSQSNGACDGCGLET